MALERKPARNDLLEIFQALGRVYQRTQKNDQALQVWNRLEALFPNDARVQEQIAAALAEENQPAQALPRFEALAKKASDPFRQVQFAMQTADLKVKLGESSQALRDFESMLAKLRPDSWLHREVRRKIEEVFLRNDNRAGLVSYYESWTKEGARGHRGGLVRIGRTLAAMGRAAEAPGLYEKAIKLAPTRRDLRLALISQLNQDQKYAEAAAQYEALDQADPNNPDTLRDWGGLFLRDTTKPPPERKTAAAAVWRKLLVAKPNDPVATAQVADLLRQADMVDDALALYKKAVELAPNNPQYREYLGEYLHNLKRADEARATWAQIAAGANKNAKNLTRLAEVLAGFGYVKDAIAPLAEAVALDKDDFGLRLKLADYAHRLERYDDAEVQLAAASKLAEKDEEKTALLEVRVKNDLAAGRLAARIEGLRKELDGDKAATAERWGVLARYLEADTKLPEAVRAADRAIGLDPRSIPAWTLAARVRESAGNLGDSADALRRLAEIDRRNRTEHLTGIAKIEARLGRIDAALKAGRDLLAAAPGNPDNYEFFAQLCFGLGRSEEGLDALRRAVRVNPNDTKIVLTLAETLAGQYRTDEAIEMYWRAFDKAGDLDAKLGTVTRLTELYLQRNQFDRLLTRLQNQERDNRPAANQGQAQQRDVAICTAQAYATSGDLGSARAELERLLAASTKDTQLLQQLSKLAEEEGDVESGARYQKQLNELAPSDDNASRLAQLYTRYGELEEAQAVWSKMASGKSEAHRIFHAMDSLLAQKKLQPVIEATESLIRKNPHDWEALYRQGFALQALEKPAEAGRRFQAVLDVPIGDDEKSAMAKAWTRDPKLRPATARATTAAQQVANPMQDRVATLLQIRIACGLEKSVSMSSRGVTTVWGPQDFGQARMAAMGWLLNLAQKQSQASGVEQVKHMRTAAEKTPADPRALWDWYYLCLLRSDNAGAFAAAKNLSRAAATDHSALWAYLISLRARQRPLGTRVTVAVAAKVMDQKDDTPPLDKNETEHVLDCYRSLQARRPELAAMVLQSVVDELKRAKAVDGEERFYREAIDGAKQLAQVEGALSLAAGRGDTDALIQLADRAERLQSGRAASAFGTVALSLFYSGTAISISQWGMSVRADQKAYADVLRLLDYQLAASRRKLEQQSPSATRAGRARLAMRANVGQSYAIWVGKTRRSISISFPKANEYLDDSAIQVLRNAFELYKRDDIVSDLIGHFHRQVDAAPTPADAVYPRLALSSIYWWNDDKSEAIAEFTKVADESKSESELRLDLAELLEQQGERTDALALADAVQPLDNSTMKRREELALRLAVMIGDLERARQAAERLFGLRLDTDTQVRLASQMSQLGQHELAEAVLGRARRRAGNRATALVGMMLQYQRQGKLDTAVQVAMQILRSTTAMRQTNPNVYYAEDPDASRTAAIGVLARSGRLPQLIDRTLEQLKKTPNSIQIHQTLADYYKAANQREKARAELAKIVELRPDDTNLRYQIATQLTQEGQPAAAIEHYKVILAKDPSVLGRYISQVQRAFQQAGKGEELIALLEKTDLRQFGQPYVVFNMISNLSFDDKLRDRSIPLFKKAWAAYPDERASLMSYVNNDQLWQLPEMIDYAREALLPKPGTFVPLNQWNSVSQIISYNSDGRMNSMVGRLLDLAVAQGKLNELAAEVDATRKVLPAWKAGIVFSALIDCRLGRYERAQASVRQFLDETKGDTIQYYVYWIIGAELEDHAETRARAVSLYQTSVKRQAEDANSRFDFDYGPAKRLVSIYTRDNRLEDARRILVESARNDENPSQSNIIYPDGYLEQMRMRALSSAAGELLKLGFPSDAATLYIESLSIAKQVSVEASNYIGNMEGLVRQNRDALDRAIEEIKPGDLAATLSRMIDQSGTADPKKTADPEKSRSAPKKADQILDLAVLVHPQELDKATVRSLLADTIAATAKVSSPDGAKGRERLATALEASRKKHPDDFSVAVADALVALSSGESAFIDQALGRLKELVEKTPFDPLESGARANARQRVEAARQIPLWLVARACWKQKESAKLAPLAEELAIRAREAARRQTENRMLLAMLREQGELALARGERAGAEAAWSRMLQHVVEPTDRLVKKPDPKPKKPPAQPNAAVSPPRATSMAPSQNAGVIRLVSYQDQEPVLKRQSARPARAGAQPKSKAGAPSSKDAPARARAAGPRTKGAMSSRSNLPLLTLDRFEQAMQIARLAAEHDLPELSVRAVNEALRAGPPIIPAPNTNTTSTRVLVRSKAMGMTVDEGPVDQVSPRVVANLSMLEGIWRTRKMSALAIYQTLRDAVLPPSRPDEVFLYSTPLQVSALRKPQSASKLLAAWAVKAGKADELKQALAARKGQPMAELPVAILNAQLAMAMDDPAATTAALKAIAARVKLDTSRNTTDLACHAAIPALDRPQAELVTAAIDVLETATKSMESSGQPEPLASLLLMLARRQFQLGDAAGGRKRLDSYVDAMEKNTIRYSGDYPLYLRKQQLERVAAELVRAGLWADGLQALARFVDAPAYSGGDPPIDESLVRLLRQLDTAPAKERYETLRAWTMPAKDRRVVRILTSLAANDAAPEVFSRSATIAKSKGDETVVSTTTSLIEAARQAGALDQLAAEARAAADLKGAQKVENAEAFYLLVELARGEGIKVAPRIEARLAELIKENESRPVPPINDGVARVRRTTAASQPLLFPWTDCLVARATLRDKDPAIINIGERLTEALDKRAEMANNLAVTARLRGELAEAAARRAGAPEALSGSIPALWHASDMWASNWLSKTRSRSAWVAHQGLVSQPSGSTAGMLLFDYPITGSYEVTVDAYADPRAGSSLSHNGLAITPAAASVAPVGGSEVVNIFWRLSRSEGFNRVTVQVEPEKVRYLVNGHLFYQDDEPSPTSPWLGLLTHFEGMTSAWRNFKIQGEPKIPREVHLSAGDRLEGWVTSFYSETQPARRTESQTDQYGSVVQVRSTGGLVLSGAPARKAGGKKPRPPVKLEDFDWAAQEGVIHGRRVFPDTSVQRQNVVYSNTPNTGTEANQSRIYYFRPLLNGDSITYEFLYEPGQVMVHPAIDRLAFLLDEGGVRVHWMTVGGDDLSGLPADNAAEEPANRRGPKPIPLKAGQWNGVKLSLAQNNVTLELNGQTIYERPLESSLGRQFGLFHYKDQTTAQARKFVLRGKWPEALTRAELANLLAPDSTSPLTDSIRRARHAVIGERFFALQAGEIVEEADQLAPSERYALLADWVLPAHDHPVWRLEGDFTPAFPPPAGTKSAPTVDAVTDARPGARLQSGGELRAPAIALVETAKALGKLDELAKRATAINVEPESDRAANERGRFALDALIQIARDDETEAAKALESMKARLDKRPLDQPQWTHWPEMVLAARALERRALRSSAQSLLETMSGLFDPKSGNPADPRVAPGLWKQRIDHLRGRASVLAQLQKEGPNASLAFGTDPVDSPWVHVTPSRAESRGLGEPYPHWSHVDGQLTHYPGHVRDLLYLNVPLRGDFRARLRAHFRTRARDPGRVWRTRCRAERRLEAS